MSEEINLSALKESEVVYAYSSTFNAVIPYTIEDIQYETSEIIQYFAVQRNETDTPDYLYFTEKDIDFIVFKTEKECVKAREMRKKLTEAVKDAITTADLYNRFGELQLEGVVNRLIRSGVKI